MRLPTVTAAWTKRIAVWSAGWGVLALCEFATSTPAWAQAAAPVAAPTAPAPPAAADTPKPDLEKHPAGGIAPNRNPVRGPAAAAAADPVRQAALHGVQARIACVCIENGDLRIDAGRSLAEEACPCEYAKKVRADLAEALAPLASAELSDKRRVGEQLESAFVPMAAEYERVFRYPADDFAWWMDNVRCVCEGCKPTVFFSKCQITCSPAIVYKLRSRIFFAMGFSRDELLDYYLAEYNVGKPPREQQTRDWLLPKKQRERGWAVPAVVIGGVILFLAFSVRRWARRKPEPGGSEPTPAGGPPTLDAKNRNRLLDEMDRDDEGF